MRPLSQGRFQLLSVRFRFAFVYIIIIVVVVFVVTRTLLRRPHAFDFAFVFCLLLRIFFVFCFYCVFLLFFANNLDKLFLSVRQKWGQWQRRPVAHLFGVSVPIND